MEYDQSKMTSKLLCLDAKMFQINSPGLEIDLKGYSNLNVLLYEEILREAGWGRITYPRDRSEKKPSCDLVEIPSAPYVGNRHKANDSEK